MTLRLRADSDLRAIIERLADQHRLAPEVMQVVLNDTLAVIREMVTERGRLQLRGFGTFRRKDTPARMCRNPKTGKLVAVEAQSRIDFTEESSDRKRREAAARSRSHPSGLDVRPHLAERQA